MEWAGSNGRELKEIREEEERKTAEERMAKGARRRIGEARAKKIEESRYNVLYKEIKGDMIPRYLEDIRKARDRSLVVRFGMRNEREATLDEIRSRLCRVCGEKEEKWEHSYTSA